MSNPFRVLACLPLLLAVTQAATAAPQTANHGCAAIIGASERLACYDAAFPPVAAAVDMAAERERALKEFGLNKTQLRERDPARMSVVAPDRIEATITRVSLRSTGERVVTLENGQAWLLTEVTMKGPLSNGDRVLIREASMGTHMLVTPKNIALRARRIQ
ncbi:MAG: hypothetical protein ABIO75_08395 [Thermomonas sp.]